MLYRKENLNIESKVVGDITYNIISFIRGRSVVEPQLCFVLVYAAHIALTNNVNDADDLLSFIEENVSEQRAMFVKEVARDCIEVSLQLSKMFSDKDFLAYMLVFPRGFAGKLYAESGTPESLSKLANRILDIKENERVADFGSGVGDFITLVSENKENNYFYGNEINSRYCEISRIRTDLFAKNAHVELGDMFAVAGDKKFEKIFSNYPFGMRLINLNAQTDYLESLHKRIPEIKRATSADWIFNSLIIDHLTEDGKAVAIMTNGSTWNSIDQKIREYFIRNGLVEAVIALPSNLFEYTHISTILIVLSRNNESVRLIDSTSICEQGRRQNIITDENIERIIRLLKEEGEEAVTVDFKTLQQNEFVLNPSRYLENTVEIQDGVEFGSLIKSVTRGAQLKANELDEMISDTPTDVQYLMLSNIQNGMISEDLPYLKELNPKLGKYFIGNRNLLLSKNGAPFKVAVAEIEEGRKILGNGNLFIIALDEEKVNPFFIKAFFESEVGFASLKKIVVGSTIPNISLESLKKLIVPLPPMEKQNEIADLYQAKQDEIKVLQLKLEKAHNALRGIFGEVK